VWLMLSSPNACLIIARVSVALFPDLHKIWCSSLLDLREITPGQHVHQVAWHFCTLTPKLCQYYHISLHRTTTTAVQMVAPVPEIMATASYVPKERRPGGPQRRPWQCGKGKKSSASSRNRTPHRAHSPVTILIELPQLTLPPLSLDNTSVCSLHVRHKITQK
jgi:hypothetical protein